MTGDYPLSRVIEVMKPSKIDPNRLSQLAKLDELFASPHYVAEEKIDGCHYVNIGGRFFSTQLSRVTGLPVEKTENFPHLVEAILRLDMPNVVLDGEVYYPEKTSQHVVMISGSAPDIAIAKQRELGWVHYKVFDILRDPDGRWLFDQPWRVRREILEALASKIRNTRVGEYLEIIDVVRTRKKEFLDRVLENGGEGVVLKHVNGLYYMGKRPQWNWVKVKTEIEDDVIIMGYEPATKIYTGKDFDTWPYWENGVPVTKYYALGWIGAIVFGKYNRKGELVRLGTCSGMDEATRKEFSEHGDKYIGRVIKIKAMQRTESGAYRHPKFVSLHADKNSHECVL